MGWLILARIILAAALLYTAAALRPLEGGLTPNLLVGLALTAVIILFEVRLRHTPPSAVIGATIGGAVGLTLAKAFSAALFWIAPDLPRVAFLHLAVLALCTYLGVLIGARHG